MTHQVRETETDQPLAGVLPAHRNFSLSSARIALIHYWFVNRRGGERVVEAMAEMLPQADLYSLVVDPEALPASLQNRSITTSFLQHVPGSRRWHRRMLPLYPLALELFDLSKYDLVISSESGPAKGVLTSSRTCHVCYCHSPMRYLWDFYHQYKSGNSFGALSRPFFTLAAHYLRMWDTATASRVDHFVANSRNVAARVRKHYRREAAVIYPPVNVAAGYLADRIEDYYLVVGQLVDYKRVDLAIAACNQLGRPLRIVGDGEQYPRLRKLAAETISFLGPLSDADLREQYAHCRALLFPGEEDFGIVPVEALSFGRPVIAFGRGGVTETVHGAFPGIVVQKRIHAGIFFREQNITSLVQAIRTFEASEDGFSPLFIRSQAERFDAPHFKGRFWEYLSEKLSEFQNQAMET